LKILNLAGNAQQNRECIQYNQSYRSMCQKDNQCKQTVRTIDLHKVTRWLMQRYQSNTPPDNTQDHSHIQ
jgi:hypothetical protein